MHPCPIVFHEVSICVVRSRSPVQVWLPHADNSIVTHTRTVSVVVAVVLVVVIVVGTLGSLVYSIAFRPTDDTEKKARFVNR